MSIMRSPLLLAAATLALFLSACNKPVPAAKPPMADAPAASAAMPEISDTEVTTRVKTALLSDDMTKAFDVNIATTKGDVRRTGTMDSQAQIDQALRLARATGGVRAAHDEPAVKR